MHRSAVMHATSTSLVLLGAVLALAPLGCGHATRNASPQSKVQLTGAAVPGPKAHKILVAEKGSIGMVTRGGCVASVGTSRGAEGSTDEMRIRCPKPGRLDAWFAGVDRMLATVPVVEVPDDEEDISLPVAELVTANATVLKLTRRADTERIIGEVRALTAELGAGEEPRPGPASSSGWQMMRVAGPAHVFLGGEPTNGVLDARISTSGQYLCEFQATTSDGPLRATKSGWIATDKARSAIDEVLMPFEATSQDERRPPTYAAAITNGAERRANAASTAAVFERFSSLQDALGDACIPELEPPAPVGP